MAEQAVCAFRDLLTQDSLVERGRQLFLFTKNPVIVGTPKMKHSELTDEALQQAYFEHCLREIVRDFYLVLQELSKAELEYYRIFALDLLCECLPCFAKCDLRQTVVGTIINKFGDLTRKI